MTIDPIKWLDVANERCPKLSFTTPWFDGTTHPVRIGFFERHFTDSMNIGSKWSIQYWDGKCWRSRPKSKPHWRQVGDYPAWRGLTKAQHDVQNHNRAACWELNGSNIQPEGGK